MKALLLALALLAGCSTGIYLPNGCVVDAISFTYARSAQAQLEGKTEFNKVLLVSFTDQQAGHALSIFEHEGELWAYDYAYGSRKIGRAAGGTPSANIAILIYPAWRVKGAQWISPPSP